jgi:hypothetical protein
MCLAKTRVHDIEQSYFHEFSAVGPSDNHYEERLQDFIDTVSASFSPQKKTPDRAFVSLQIGPEKLRLTFKIDTGSAVNIISHQIYDQLRRNFPLEPLDYQLTSYSGDFIKVQGKVRLQ